ncbi:GGDEF domain-containing protein [Roseateles amylovorans]|uniref:diguanylate cyclase n=1 Tax=Roseateles amylovorans TaxID=2978473 RepID=A0ABY6B3V9_9BURK|nr:GGDEF domain-containing protein [Roseateles amylovorans]UXH78213.1 GGDEF domain-containing protein [Roseateles amylovorans]
MIAAGLGAAAQAHGPDRALDLQLSQWERQSYNDPGGALRGLRALRVDPQHADQRMTIDYMIGRVQAVSGDVDQARLIGDELESRPGGAPLARILRAEVQDRIGLTVKAGDLAQQALADLEPACVPTANAAHKLGPNCQWRATYHAMRLLARAQGARGELAFADARLRQALALAQAVPDAYTSAQTMGLLALSAQSLDQSAIAHQWVTQASQLSQGDVLAMVRIRMIEATLAARRADQQAQRAALEDGLRLAEHADARREVASMRTNLADAYMHSNEPAKAAEQARAALPVVLEFGDQRLERTLRHNLSVALILLRQLEPARREIERVNEIARGDSDNVRRSLQLRELGEAYAKVGQWREALRLYHEERALSAETAQRNRESSLQQLRLKYDSEAKQRDLELLRRDQALKRQELANRRLAQYVGVGLAALLGLSVILLGVMLVRVRDANRQLRVNQRLLRAQSERDPLTDLANRRHFLSVMDRQARTEFQGALLMIDIDHFKVVNDRHGHAAGDAVICEVARRISQAVRIDDLVVRWGGEEFLVFAPGVAQEQLQLMAERILMTVGDEPIPTEDGALSVTCSIGFAHFPLAPAQLTLHWEQAVNWADMALYTAKSQGRNRARGVIAVQASDAQALRQIEANFEAACSSGLVTMQTLRGPDEEAVSA